MGLFMKLDGIPEPPEGYVPPLGSSRNTWTNIYKNKGRIDYCVQQFGVSCRSRATGAACKETGAQHSRRECDPDSQYVTAYSGMKMGMKMGMCSTEKKFL